MSKKYSLTETQIRHLAIICYREQGANIAGVKACASHMCNYYEGYQTKKYSNPYDCTIKSGWYGKESFNLEWLAYHQNVPQTVVNAVRSVIVDGNRTLPEYVDEYDCLTDVSKASNNGVSFPPEDRTKYVKDVTKIKNRYGSEYTFHCFPDGSDGYCDAFGYINKPTSANTPKTANKSTTDTIEAAVSWMENLARDDSHGYDQQYRWGERGDYDCSSAVITAWESAGVPVKTMGAVYTGNMRDIFIQCGFQDVTNSVNLATGSGLVRGDVLLNYVKHTAMYCGNGKQVDAIGNENNGAATGGQPGDQTGREILIRDYRGNYDWDCVLRYKGSSNNPVNTSSIRKTVSFGSTGSDVLYLQKLLKKAGYVGGNGKPLELDGECGTNTVWAIRCYQADHGLEMDGVCGKMTWQSIIKGVATA